MVYKTVSTEGKMKRLGFCLPLLMWLLIYIPNSDAVCKPLEQGREGVFHCNNYRPGPNDILSLRRGKGIHWKTVAECSRQGCTDHYQILSNSTVTSHGSSYSAQFVIRSMSRLRPFNMEKTWECIMGSTYRNTICDPLRIYARAKHPVCGIPVYTGTTNDEILLKCTTNKVYPRAVCSYSAVLENGTEKQLLGPVTYNHTTVPIRPMYYNTECAVRFSLSSIPKNIASFALRMQPSQPGIGADGITTVQIPIARPSVALHTDCPNGDVKDGYIKSGTTATCRCIVSTAGFPAGYAQWYTTDGTPVGTRNTADGSTTLTISEPPQQYYCLPETFFGNGSAVYFLPKFEITPSVALHNDCPKWEVKNGYIKSCTTATCRCILTKPGYPDGHAQWYTQNGTKVGIRNVSDGSATLTINEPPQQYYCLPETFFGNGSAVYFLPKFEITPSVALHDDCPKGEVQNGYIKSGTTATCRCILTRPGWPAGHAQWYTQEDGAKVGIRNATDGSATLTINEPPQRYYCLPEPFSGNGSVVVFFSPKFGNEIKELVPREKPRVIVLFPNGTAVVSFEISGYPEPAEFVLNDVKGSTSRKVNSSMYSVSYTSVTPPLGRVTVNLGPGLGKGSHHYILTVINGFGDGLDLEFKVEPASSDDSPVSSDLIIGLSIGGAVILLAIVFFIWVYWRRHRNHGETMRDGIDVNSDQVHRRRGHNYENTLCGPDRNHNIITGGNPDLGCLDPKLVSKHLSSLSRISQHVYDEPDESRDIVVTNPKSPADSGTKCSPRKDLTADSSNRPKRCVAYENYVFVRQDQPK